MWRRRTVKVQVQLPERDARILEKYERKVKKFDEMFKICCCWIGYDVLLEFIPIVGKVISLFFALSLFNLACEADLPRVLRKRMLYHITVDFLLGLIPILGIFLDMLYRAHSKNARLLRKFLFDRARQNSCGENNTQEISVPTPALTDAQNGPLSQKNN
ncbi:uncharacterized protein BYT42DRAFT_587859 [Radiomyces spectabilis]|uniref:uncharacterized protein n=1 Tax=Radiomyces spectabilis TaxID=64574 RepID=UPI00221FEAF7|nr:uncharacterized protein BYT42DRAFT_587859 [Radiomyces spectabilis]KAI8366782.1 hypothetical protein BYT42DRAFT_587859 [Radiomyces spectabilis]